jgi:hypothetical protein
MLGCAAPTVARTQHPGILLLAVMPESGRWANRSRFPVPSTTLPRPVGAAAVQTLYPTTGGK